MGGTTLCWLCPTTVIPSTAYLLSPIPFVFTFFRTLLHFFARIKNSTLFFSAIPHSTSKNGPAWGIPTNAHEDQNESGKD